MRPTTPRSWQRLRTELNHDWLRNSFLPSLEKWLNLLEGRVRDDGFEKRIMAGELRRWAEVTEEIHGLIDTFPYAASPARLWEVPPLSKSPRSVRGWLPELVDELWACRIGARGLQEKSAADLDAATRAYEALVGFPGAEGRALPEPDDRRPQLVRDFRDAVFSVASSLSDFPHATEVT